MQILYCGYWTTSWTLLLEEQATITIQHRLQNLMLFLGKGIEPDQLQLIDYMVPRGRTSTPLVPWLLPQTAVFNYLYISDVLMPLYSIWDFGEARALILFFVEEAVAAERIQLGMDTIHSPSCYYMTHWDAYECAWIRAIPLDLIYTY